MRKAVILVRKDQSERIFEVIHNIVTGHQYNMEHTAFSYFDGREIAAIILESNAETLHKVNEWLKGEFSDSAFWMQATMIDDRPMIE